MSATWATWGMSWMQAKVKEIGAVDVLFWFRWADSTPLTARQAASVCEALKPKVVIPMHVKTAKCDYPITGVEDFLKGRKNVNRVSASEIEIKKDKLPAETETIVLQHAL